MVNLSPTGSHCVSGDEISLGMHGQSRRSRAVHVRPIVGYWTVSRLFNRCMRRIKQELSVWDIH